MSKPRVVHISTVHSAIDPRIRIKQLQSLSRHGMDAQLVCADPERRRLGDEVTVQRITARHRGRLYRMSVLAPAAVLRALLTPAVLYHFHDPELIPWAWLLLLRRVPVIYDVHEDYPLALRQKEYLPHWAQRVVSAVAGTLERALTMPFLLVIAEPCYQRRFPRARQILNYPPRSLLSLKPALDTSAARVLYTGNITAGRGALNLARLVAASGVEVTLVGRCLPRLAAELRGIAGENGGKLTIVGEGRYVPHAEIVAAYRTARWIAGIVLIPAGAHYRDKQLTKFFEFMAVGLPIIASDFPVWRRLIAEQGVGICVDPDDPRQAVAAVEWLMHNPEQARGMGRRGRELVRQRYHWEGQEERLLALYHDAIQG